MINITYTCGSKRNREVSISKLYCQAALPRANCQLPTEAVGLFLASALLPPLPEAIDAKLTSDQRPRLFQLFNFLIALAK